MMLLLHDHQPFDFGLAEATSPRPHRFLRAQPSPAVFRAVQLGVCHCRAERLTRRRPCLHSQQPGWQANAGEPHRRADRSYLHAAAERRPTLQLGGVVVQ